MSLIIAEYAQSDVVLSVSVSDDGGVAGLTALVALRDGPTTNNYLDWSDMTFKTSGWVTRETPMSDIGNGFYTYTLDLSAITNHPTVSRQLIAEYRFSGVIDAVSKDHILIVENIYYIPTVAMVAAVQADTDDIQARLPASLSGGRMRSQVEGMDVDVIGAAQISAGAITSSEAPALANLDAAVSSRASAASVAAVQVDTDDIQSRLPATLVSGRIRAQVEGMDADTVNASALSADAITEITGAVAAGVVINNIIANFAFDPSNLLLTCDIWLERNGEIYGTPTSVSVEFYDHDGNLLFTLTDGSPDAQGVFSMDRSDPPGFVAGASVKARVAVTIPGPTTHTALRGIQIVG